MNTIMRFLFLLIFILVTNSYLIFAQQKTKITHIDTLSILFYNVENLFDDINDSISGDDEFSSNGIRYWNTFTYESKINRIAQSILAANSWKAPALIGLSEIENKNVLLELTTNSLMTEVSYKIVHKESNDHRGIDVALLYDPQTMSLIDSAFYELELSENYYSRDILYAKMKFKEDTLHVFVCHWPSRYSGALSSEINRMKASNILKRNCIKILENDSLSKILVMGDFNDGPKDKSLLNISDNLEMINLMDDEFKFGTLKYHNQWFVFDQFIISNNLSRNCNGLYLLDKPNICSLPFLLTEDEKYMGVKPFRTFLGYKYIGGFSDHLPILIKFVSSQNNFDIPQ